VPRPIRLALLGATGLVGGEVLRLAAAERRLARVVALVRRPMDPPETTGTGPTVEVQVVDFRRPEQWRQLLRVDAIVCALGTTIRKAGSQERFREVDYDLPLGIATLGREAGARHFLLVSALGADPRSRVFYSRTKGLLEEAVRGLGYPSLTIVRPSLLLGDRGELRLAEELGKRLSFLAPPRYKPVTATNVAAALLACALSPAPGVRTVESAEIPALADRR
jgi:uncharacterized protein YbjT (DUF2867 family)